MRVGDIDATVAAWTAAGATFLTPPMPVPSARRCFLRDPDGRLIELAQLDPVPAADR
ncbi:MAG: VOC family protein [Jatrophihabitans sp.]|uniref:VOC family protein n=1 Tax=Jatrophihabitans sp. TaxID=1932789 RepID=UPI003F80135B